MRSPRRAWARFGAVVLASAALLVGCSNAVPGAAGPTPTRM